MKMSTQTALEKRQAIILPAEGDADSEVDIRVKMPGSNNRSQVEVDSGYDNTDISGRVETLSCSERSDLTLNFPPGALSDITTEQHHVNFIAASPGDQGEGLPQQTEMSLPKELTERVIPKRRNTWHRGMYPQDSPTTESSSEGSTSPDHRSRKTCCCKVDFTMLEMLKALKRKDDEYDLFAKSIVPRLRQLSDKEYLAAQKAILEAVYKANKTQHRWSYGDAETDFA